VTFGQAAVEKNCLLPMASSRGLQASNDAKCFHGHRDSGSPRVRGKLAQPLAAGLVNQTQYPDAELQAIWTEAQKSVAQKIDLKPL
jgi:hypothetical protein